MGLGTSGWPRRETVAYAMNTMTVDYATNVCGIGWYMMRLLVFNIMWGRPWNSEYNGQYCIYQILLFP